MSLKQQLSAMALALAAALSVSAHAQEQEPVAILKIDSGTVMVSEGAEFVAGATGTPLQQGQRLMVTEDAVAQIVYAEDCVVEYRTPGVYVVEPECKKLAAVPPSSGNGGMIAGAVAGVAVIAAVAGGGGSSKDPPPPPSRASP